MGVKKSAQLSCRSASTSLAYMFWYNLELYCFARHAFYLHRCGARSRNKGGGGCWIRRLALSGMRVRRSGNSDQSNCALGWLSASAEVMPAISRFWRGLKVCWELQKEVTGWNVYIVLHRLRKGGGALVDSAFWNHKPFSEEGTIIIERTEGNTQIEGTACIYEIFCPGGNVQVNQSGVLKKQLSP